MRLLCLAVVLAAPVSAAADPHPMSSGASPSPTVDTEVTMTAETLTIDIGSKAATVKAAVTLENKGEATRLVVGFPCATGDEAGSIDPPCKVPLRVTANGKKLKVTRKRESRTLSRWMWKMTFAAGQKVELVVAYRAPLVNDRYSVPAQGMGVFTYRLTTGARWAGPIGKLQITVDHMHDALLYISPAGYTREPGRLTWTFENYEPAEEVVLIPFPMHGMALASIVAARTSAEMRARLASGDYAKARVDDVIKQMKEDSSDWAGSWLPMISRLGGISAPSEERVKAIVAESIKLFEGVRSQAKK